MRERFALSISTLTVVVCFSEFNRCPYDVARARAIKAIGIEKSTSLIRRKSSTFI